MNRVIALGFFDGVHLGHRTLLDRARTLADTLGVGAAAITFDRSPGKGGLLTTLDDRVRLLKTLGRMDEVLVLPFDNGLMHTPWEVFADHLLHRFHAAALVCGWDYRFGEGAQGTAALLQAYCAAHGIRCDILPPLELHGEIVSSTRIKKLLAAGEMEQLLRCSGHAHTMSGTVVSGQGLGHRLGFPTANLIPDAALLLPKSGVYVVRGTVYGRSYPGVCNVGIKPTVDGRTLCVETWLDGFSGDLYGAELTVDFYHYLRPERKFESLQALRDEIFRNQTQARAYFATMQAGEADAT